MFRKFYPSYYVDSTYEIPFEKIYESGVRGILFDIDNTLVPHGEPADERAVALFHRLKTIGFSCCLISNNKQQRVDMFRKDIEVEAVCKALKPRRYGYEEAMKRLGTNPSNTIFIGDQLFTDVWGANRVGIQTYLVKPINPKEEIQIVLKRYLEKPLIRRYIRLQRRHKDD